MGRQSIWRTPSYDSMRHVALEIYDRYGDTVDWRNPVAKSIDKWGQNSDIDGTLTTIWQAPGTFENYLNTSTTDGNAIDSLVCTNGDYNGVVNVEGEITDGNNNLTFVVQSKQMNGTTPVTLDTPLVRLTRIEIPKAPSLAVTEFIYGYDSSQTSVMSGVPQTAAGIYIKARGGQYRQSEKGATSVDQFSYFAITELEVSIDASKTGVIEFYFQKRIVTDEFRAVINPVFVSNSTPYIFRPFKHPKIVEPNSDFRGLAQRVSGSVAIGATTRISGVFLRKLSASL